jgi:hypothetical protein
VDDQRLARFLAHFNDDLSGRILPNVPPGEINECYGGVYTQNPSLSEIAIYQQ